MILDLEPIEHLFEKDLLIEIKTIAQYQKFKKNDLIIDYGQKITHIPIVLKGIIKVIRESKCDRKELLLYYLEACDTCSVTLNCCTSNHNSQIKAISEIESHVLFIPVQKMEYWLIKYHSWRRFILNSYNDRFEEMLEALDSIAFENMEWRIIEYLKNKKIILDKSSFKLTHREIASDLNTSRVAVSRILRKLDEAGVIRQTYNKIEILK